MLIIYLLHLQLNRCPVTKPWHSISVCKTGGIGGAATRKNIRAHFDYLHIVKFVNNQTHNRSKRLPKLIVFLHLFYKHGPNYFESIRNWDKEKNKLLEAYGYSLNDDLKGKFEFNYKDNE